MLSERASLRHLEQGEGVMQRWEEVEVEVEVEEEEDEKERVKLKVAAKVR
jgi:hypothetical protein